MMKALIWVDGACEAFETHCGLEPNSQLGRPDVA